MQLSNPNILLDLYQTGSDFPALFIFILPIHRPEMPCFPVLAVWVLKPQISPLRSLLLPSMTLAGDGL